MGDTPSGKRNIIERGELVHRGETVSDKKFLTRNFVLMVALTAVTLATGISGCSMTVGTGEHHGSSGSAASREEHEGDGGNRAGDVSEGESSEGEGSEGEGSEHASAGEGEESGNTLTLTERYDTVRKGARLVLVYDVESNAFIGTVENTTSSALQQVRGEVHLSNGVELGPTAPVDLAPGQKVEVRLPATAQTFAGWTPHAEVGPGTGGEAGEHGPGGEDGEDSEDDGEHKSGD